jgi:hypothetical protein
VCLFTRPVRSVRSTSIFARGTPEGRLLLAYSAELAAREPVAMVLPLPTPPAHRSAQSEDALRFLDLSGYPELFTDLDRGFPTPSAGRGGGTSRSLQVVRVGSFVASFVPTLADFARLDPVLRLPDQPCYKGELRGNLPNQDVYV